MAQRSQTIGSLVLAGSLCAIALISPCRADESAVPAGPEGTRAARPMSSETEKELREEIALLKKRLADLERRLDEQQKAPPAAPAAGSLDLRPAGRKGGDEEPEEPPATARSVTTRQGSRVEFGGFAQVRATNMGDALGNRAPTSNFDFQITRFRPRVIFIIDPHWEADLDLNVTSRSVATASFAARDAYLQWQNHGLQGRMGQSKVPFGYEVYLEGDPDRVEMERARILGVLFPDERDLGIFFRTAPANKGATWGAIAVYNGNGINRLDNNTNKDVAATIKVPLDRHNTIGLSAAAGDFTPAGGGPSLAREVAGIEHQFIARRLKTKMEALAGRDMGANIWGGYAGAQYYTGRFGGPFARYDLFDPNLDAPHDLFRRLAFGWWKDLTKSVRITGEYDRVTNPLVGGGTDTYGVQLQSRF
jgi:hypothetical protein